MTIAADGQPSLKPFTPYTPSSAEIALTDMADAFVALDADWRVAYFNDKAERLFHRAASDVLGHVASTAFPELRGSALQRAWEQALRTRSTQRVEAYVPQMGRWFVACVYPTDADGITVYFLDVTQQKRTEIALRESEERFRAIFEQAPVGIALCDMNGHWLQVNPKLCAILGYTCEELLARRFQDDTFPADLPADLEQMQRTLRAHAAGYQLEKRFVRKSGVPVWCRMTVALVRKPDTGPRYFIKIVEDISARKAAETMVGGAAHELRSPVAHIKGFISTLREGELPPSTRQEFMAEAERETDRLAELIEDLLEHTAGPEAARRVALAPNVLIARSLERVRQNLGTRLVEVNVPSDLPALDVDVQSMERVLVNLLHNANKYSPETSPIQISAHLDASGRKLAIHVDDQGPGIPVDEREAIFEPFYRSASARASAAGQGLGLAICRAIVTTHGGEITVEDAPAGGARFTVVLPLEARVAAQQVRRGKDRQHCACCGASRPGRVVRVSTPEDSYGSWLLCERCWHFLEVGFKTQRPAEILEEQLQAVFPLNAEDVRSWITTGAKQVGREGQPAGERRLRRP